MHQLITDDELVAIAVSLGVPWRGLLPTVQVATDELRRAAFRGSRSLAIRGLADRTLEMMRLVVKSEPRLLAFVSAEASPMVPAASGVGIYPTPSASVMLDIALPTGVHDFSAVSRDRAQQVIFGFVARFLENGSVLGRGYAITVLLAGSADVGSPVLMIRDDGTSAHQCVKQPSGQVEVGPIMGRPDVRSAVEAALVDGGVDASEIGWFRTVSGASSC